jgi:hypothetical protein
MCLYEMKCLLAEWKAIFIVVLFMKLVAYVCIYIYDLCYTGM